MSYKSNKMSSAPIIRVQNEQLFLPIFCAENVECIIFIFNALLNTFTMKANTMNPDQTAPLGAV